MELKKVLGQYAEDPVTSYKGTVVSVTEYLTGVPRCTVERLGPDGKIQAEHFDLDRLIIGEKPAHLKIWQDRSRDDH